jgi:hypothetical protein
MGNFTSVGGAHSEVLQLYIAQSQKLPALAVQAL